MRIAYYNCWKIWYWYDLREKITCTWGHAESPSKLSIRSTISSLVTLPSLSRSNSLKASTTSESILVDNFRLFFTFFVPFDPDPFPFTDILRLLQIVEKTKTPLLLFLLLLISLQCVRNIRMHNNIPMKSLRIHYSSSKKVNYMIIHFQL